METRNRHMSSSLQRTIAFYIELCFIKGKLILQISTYVLWDSHCTRMQECSE